MGLEFLYNIREKSEIYEMFYPQEKYANHYGFEACNGTPLLAKADEKNSSKTCSQLLHKKGKKKSFHCFKCIEIPESICIDEYSRILFPVCFVAFTTLYGTIYLQHEIT